MKQMQLWLIITKIENVEGLANLDAILEEADAQMIARGDMATETDFTEPPVVQKKIIKLCNKECKPVITATQMLESMTHQPLPTRAEEKKDANDNKTNTVSKQTAAKTESSKASTTSKNKTSSQNKTNTTSQDSNNKSEKKSSGNTSTNQTNTSISSKKQFNKFTISTCNIRNKWECCMEKFKICNRICRY